MKKKAQKSPTLKTLQNGLRLLCLPIPMSQVVMVGTFYRVGSAYESKEKTGLAHLLEHIMCSGSAHIENYDALLQKAGGSSNADTIWDMTCYWSRLPASQIEKALWIESERMFFPKLSKEVIDVQKKVVEEEFKQVALGRPYGDFWHHFLPLLYQKHPYQWPVIGKKTEHIRSFTQADVLDFHKKFYHPSNAVVVAVGGVEAADFFEKATAWFNCPPPQSPYHPPTLPQEKEKKEVQRGSFQGKVPQNALYLGYCLGKREEKKTQMGHLLSMLLTGGDGAWLHHHLVEEKAIFSTLESFITGTIDPGALIIEAKMHEGISFEMAEEALVLGIKKALDRFERGDFERIKRQIKAHHIFDQVRDMEKIDALGWSFWIDGSLDFFEKEIKRLETMPLAEAKEALHEVIKEGPALYFSYKKAQSRKEEAL